WGSPRWTRCITNSCLSVSSPRGAAAHPTSISISGGPLRPGDRKSTRLNSSHVSISYAVFCLKKKKNHQSIDTRVSHLTPDSCAFESHPLRIYHLLILFLPCFLLYPSFPHHYLLSFPTRRSSDLWGSPRWTRCITNSCLSVSSPRGAAAHPTSISISGGPLRP